MNNLIPHLSLIVAMADNRVIGNRFSLPWPKQKQDMLRFVRYTLNKPVIMGRKTYDSIGKPLEGRKMIVLSRSCVFPLNVVPVSSPAHALEVAGAWNEAVVIGGGEIYKLFLPLVETIYLTRIHIEVEGDTIFPELKQREWTEVNQQTVPAADGQHSMTFSTLRRTWYSSSS